MINNDDIMAAMFLEEHIIGANPTSWGRYQVLILCLSIHSLC